MATTRTRSPDWVPRPLSEGSTRIVTKVTKPPSIFLQSTFGVYYLLPSLSFYRQTVVKVTRFCHLRQCTCPFHSLFCLKCVNLHGPVIFHKIFHCFFFFCNGMGVLKPQWGLYLLSKFYLSSYPWAWLTAPPIFCGYGNAILFLFFLAISKVQVTQIVKMKVFCITFHSLVDLSLIPSYPFPVVHIMTWERD